MRRWIHEQPKVLLLGLIAIDAAFIVLHVATDGGRGPLTSLDTDRGFAGIWGFGKAAVAAWLVYQVFRRTQLSVYLAWAVTFVTIGLDDLMEIHENLGLKVARAVDLPEVAGLRGQDLGELLVWAGLGVPLLLAIAWTLRSADRRGRYDSVAFFLLIGILVFFAAGLDALHMSGSDDVTTMWDVTVTGVLEDGGELMGLTLLLTTATAARRSRGATARSAPTAARAAGSS